MFFCLQTPTQQTIQVIALVQKPLPKEKGNINVSNIPKLVDNKRKHMEKRLSLAQRDQVLMSTVKDDLHIKKNMIDAIEKSNKTLDESISKMTTCLTSIGDGIAAGMQMLAMALANLNPPVNYPQPNYPPQFGNYGSFGASPPVAPTVSHTSGNSQEQHVSYIGNSQVPYDATYSRNSQGQRNASHATRTSQGQHNEFIMLK